MTASYEELGQIIRSIDDLWYTETYDKIELPEAEYLAILAKKQTKNKQALTKIRELLATGFSLDFTDYNNQSVMDWAVTQNNVELIELLLEYGVSFSREHLCRAAQFGADRVVKFLIETQGISPARKLPQDYSVLAAARSARRSGNVLPYLIEVLKKYKSERLPPPKKPRDLTEENLLKHLPSIGLPTPYKQTLDNIIESIFVEEHSVSLAFFYESIAEQNPELIFACLELIREATSAVHKEKTTKKLPWAGFYPCHIHHGNLTIEGKLDIRSLAVTGNLTVKGHASNVEGRALFVGGDFTCETLYTEGPVIVGGNLTATKIHACYNDYSLHVKQTLKADMLTIERHLVKAKTFEVNKRIEKY